MADIVLEGEAVLEGMYMGLGMYLVTIKQL
jgi:hypothetical protein